MFQRTMDIFRPKMSGWFIVKKIRLYLAIFKILELVTTWINQPRLEKEEFVMVVPGRKGLHLLVTFVNIKDIIKALFICNTGHNNNKQPLVINHPDVKKVCLLQNYLLWWFIHSCHNQMTNLCEKKRVCMCWHHYTPFIFSPYRILHVFEPDWDYLIDKKKPYTPLYCQTQDLQGNTVQ